MRDYRTNGQELVLVRQGRSQRRGRGASPSRSTSGWIATASIT